MSQEKERKYQIKYFSETENIDVTLLALRESNCEHVTVNIFENNHKIIKRKS